MDIKNIRCWWFGCEPHPQDPTDPEFLECMHCDEIISYGDMVGDTRHNRFKEWCNYYLFRKWWPEKCSSCGHRFKCDDDVDHIPF